MSNGELVRQTLAGRAEAYGELARRWAPRVTALCHAKVGRADVADDLAQETLLRGLRALPTLVEPDKFGAWLCGIALRTCLDWLKARERSQVCFSALGPGWEPDRPAGAPPDDAVSRDDEASHLLREVEALPESYRRVVLLYYYEDLTYRDLARLLGVSAATVNARLTRARALLRERLSHCRR